MGKGHWARLSGGQQPTWEEIDLCNTESVWSRSQELSLSGEQFGGWTLKIGGGPGMCKGL